MAEVPVELYGGVLDGMKARISPDVDGGPPLERVFEAISAYGAYRLATQRPDGVYVYVPLVQRKT